tara:strand:+ start:187 stop:933 length:747 start_codon:yes stop_codon:yes gene_type:complete
MGSTQKNVMLGGNKGKIDKLPKKQNDYIDKAQSFMKKPKKQEKVEKIKETETPVLVDKNTLKLVPPRDPRVNSAIAPFSDDMLEEDYPDCEMKFKDRKELADAMFKTMKKYGGIGLTCNQVGLPFNMFTIGDHPDIEKGLKMACFNPMIITKSEETVVMKEGCLTFPFVFLSIERPRKVVVKYEDEDGQLREGHLDGMISRIFQHEYDHILGKNFTDGVSKLKLDMAYKKAAKQMKAYEKHKKAMEKL